MEDEFSPEYHLVEEQDPDDSRICLSLINMARPKDSHTHPRVDRAFENFLDAYRPDVVHIGHLIHLSLSLPRIAASLNIPVIFTAHDFWPLCPRGQFIQMYPKAPSSAWALCDGQDDRKCALRCYRRYFGGNEDEQDVSYWTNWVADRMRCAREAMSHCSVVIAPSRQLLKLYRDEGCIPEERLVYLDYGFPLARFAGRRRLGEQPYVFGYIGTHIAAKGVDLLIRAFGQLRQKPLLRIWGRRVMPQFRSLELLAKSLPGGAGGRVEWRGEYDNREIVRDVFNCVDAIVAPSIWLENSPLVIHEAQQARIPVITADAGGMAEYVQHQTNGLLFKHRDADALALQMQRLVDAPELGQKLGQRGYLHSDTGDVPAMDDHVRELLELYSRAIQMARAPIAIDHGET